MAAIILLVVAGVIVYKQSQQTPTPPGRDRHVAGLSGRQQQAPVQTVVPFIGLSGPGAVAVDPAGTVYVADTDNNRVVKLAPESAAQQVIPFSGLNRPLDLAVDAASNVYVVDLSDRLVDSSPWNARCIASPANWASGSVWKREGDCADFVVIDPAGLDDSVSGYHEERVPFYGGLSRMVNRNDAAVVATGVNGAVVFRNGQFRDGHGQTAKSGRYLRAAVDKPRSSSSSVRV